MRAHEAGQRVIEMRQLGQSTAENDHLRINDIDDMGEAARQSVLMARQRRLRMGVTALRGFNDSFR